MSHSTSQHPDAPGWGTTPPDAGRRSGWSTLRAAILWLLLVLGVIGAGGGVTFVVADMAETDDEWHGFGIFLGLLFGVPSLAALVLAAFALGAIRRSGPTAGRVQSAVLGAVLVVLTPLAPGFPLLVVPALAGMLLLTAVAMEGRQDSR